MIGRIVDMVLGMNGKQRLTLELDSDFTEQAQELGASDLDIQIKKYRKRRSLNANAYFHVLVNKIARKLGESEERIKKNLVTEYGALAKDKDGNTVGFKIPDTVNAESIYPYIKCFDTRHENGLEFNRYLVYKETHKLDSSEMAKLIDGTIETAKELGIETLPPAQLARMKESYRGG